MSLTRAEIAIIINNAYDRTSVLRELKRRVGMERLQEIYRSVVRFTFDPQTVLHPQQVQRTLHFLEDARRDNSAVFVSRYVAGGSRRMANGSLDSQSMFPSFEDYRKFYISQILAWDTPKDLSFVDGAISGAVYYDGLLHVDYLFDGQRVYETVYFFNESIFLPKDRKNPIIHDMSMDDFAQMVEEIDTSKDKVKRRRYGYGYIFNQKQLGTFAIYTHFDPDFEAMYDEEMNEPYSRESLQLNDFIDRRP